LPKNIILTDGSVTFWLTVAEYFVGHCSKLERHLTYTAPRNMTVLTSQRRTILKSILMSLLDRANYCPMGNFVCIKYISEHSKCPI